LSLRGVDKVTDKVGDKVCGRACDKVEQTERNQTMKHRQTITIALLTLAAAVAFAQVGQEPAGRIASPILDVPLRDTAVTRGKDGTYYLTGTACAGMSGKDSYLSDFEPDDFSNNDGIWLWKSSNLKDWESLGQVWSIYEEVKKSPSIFHAKNRWHTDWNVRHDRPNSPKVRGMTSPELHQVKGDRIAPKR
jgi:hypothetical protein